MARFKRTFRTVGSGGGNKPSSVRLNNEDDEVMKAIATRYFRGCKAETLRMGIAILGKLLGFKSARLERLKFYSMEKRAEFQAKTGFQEPQ